jgi:repressor LexA
MEGFYMNIKSQEKLDLILNFVKSEVKLKGYPPSVREICKAVGFKSTSTVHSYLEKLQEEGLLLKGSTKPRALKVIADDYGFSNKDLVGVPIVGSVTAGQPILAIENIEDTFPIPSEYLQNATTFMLKVKGESMIDAGILDGDLILIKQQVTANNGDIVVALIGEEATVKTFYKEKNHIRLQPENKSMQPIIVTEDISIIGKVIGVFRLL